MPVDAGRLALMRAHTLIWLLPALCFGQYEARVAEVTKTRGFVALWDFTERTPEGRFAARVAKGEKADLSLEVTNYVRAYWGLGREATMADVPVVDEGPFGKAAVFRTEEDPDFMIVGVDLPLVIMGNSTTKVLPGKRAGSCRSLSTQIRPP